MTVTHHTRAAHEAFGHLSPDQQDAINTSLDAFLVSLRDAGFVAMGDDRAENLFGAVMQYLHDCDPKHIPNPRDF